MTPYVSTVAFRSLIETDERLRKEVADLLHGSVQSRLSACVLWLKMCEDHLNGVQEEGTSKIDIGKESAAKEGTTKERVNRDSAAKEGPAKERAAKEVHDTSMILQSLERVRLELSLLLKGDVQRAIQALYPTLIGIGLRPALESWRQSQVRFLDITIEADPGFNRWDLPSNDDENAVQTRLELFRLIERLVELLQVPQQKQDAQSDDRPTVNILLGFNETEKELWVRLETTLGDLEDHDYEEIFSGARIKPECERFLRAGGHIYLEQDNHKWVLTGSIQPGRFNSANSFQSLS